MEIERVTHYVDNVLTQAEARMGLRNTKLLVAWYTNQKKRPVRGPFPPLP